MGGAPQDWEMGLWDSHLCCPEPAMVVAPGLWATRLMACSGPSDHLECATGRSSGTPLQSNLCASPGSLLPHGPFLHPLLGPAGHSLLQVPGPSFLALWGRPSGPQVLGSQLPPALVCREGALRDSRGEGRRSPQHHRVTGGPGHGRAGSQVGQVSGGCTPKHERLHPGRG